MNFDLDAALRQWRQRLRQHPGIEPGMEEELVSHFHDAIDDEMANGADARTAYERVLAQRFGDLDALARDFYRARAVTYRPASWDGEASRFSLFMSYLRTAYRKLTRRRGYALMNVAGLAIAMTCAFLALVFIVDELGFDAFHPDADRLYRVAVTATGPEGETTVTRTPGPLTPLLDEVEPRIETSIRFIDIGPQFTQHEGEGLNVDGVLFVDSTFFDIFGFELLRGNPSTALRQPNATVITESTARRFFGDADPVGRVLTLSMMGNDRPYTVEGVVEDPPRQSHIRFDLLLPFAFWDSLPEDQRAGFDNWVMNWRVNRVISYVRLREGTDIAALEAELPTLVAQHVDEDDRAQYALEAVPDIYLRSPLQNELGGPEGDIRYLYLLATIGMLILLIAGINFVNLSTAHAGERAKETGIRKAMGAQPSHLVAQYLGESVVIALGAMLVAVLASTLLMPAFGDLVGKPFTLSLGGAWPLWLLLPALALVVGLAAGLYPAFVLAAFEPSRALRSTGGTQTRQSAWLRHTLVVSQFTAAAVLFTGALVVNEQMDLFQNKKLGYSKEQVVLVPIDGSDLGERAQTLKTQLVSVPGVRTGSAVSYVPGQSSGEQSNAYPFRTAGMADSDDPLMWDIMPVDHDFLKTMDIELAAGRFFSLDFPADSTTAFVINEAAARAMNWTEPVGQPLDWYMPGPDGFDLQQSGRVVGVVEDFHTYSLHETIQPVVMMLPVFDWFKSQVALKLAPDGVRTTLANVETTWDATLPGVPFEYSFLDEEYDRLYVAEATTGRVFGIMTTLALFVACLGLVGLSSYITHQRTKEIGIRKVLGAGTLGLLFRLMRGFLGLVALSVAIAVPVAWLGLDRWLDRFAYRIDIGPEVFGVVALTSLAIAAAVVSYHTVRAALTDPVRSLRSE